MYCAEKLGYTPGELVIGNSVYSMGFLGGIGAAFRGLAGGEIPQLTEITQQGRHKALERLQTEMKKHGAVGVSGVSSEIAFLAGNIEFLSVGSCLLPKSGSGESTTPFSTSGSAQELFCQVDSYYTPKGFVFGNVAYSPGIAGGILGGFKSLGRGEIREFSDVFDKTRHLALQRISAEAKALGANSVVGIKTEILPLGGGAVEMIMIGTAAHNHQIDKLSATGALPDICTSDLTCAEMWNTTKIGYAPIEVVVGTSVYSIGLGGAITAAFQNFVKGEIDSMTALIYEAREESIQKLRKQAADVGADDILGIKTYIYPLGSGIIEFLAIGTAVRRVPDLTTKSEQLPPQAFMEDKDTFINPSQVALGSTNTNSNSNSSDSTPPANSTPLGKIIGGVFTFFIFVVIIFSNIFGGHGHGHH
jgi:uncharacterized protein YbjQ (UPF0145 family)